MHELIFYILFPLILILALYIFFLIYYPSFDKIGIGKREVGLLFLGSISTTFLNFPIFIYKDYFLAMNIGGALIPIVLSFYLIKENSIPFYKILIGITIVSFATYMVTKVTSAGVISYFPFYLFPSILAFLLSMLFYFLSPFSCAYSYPVATIGVIIGGDFSHLPEIFEHPFIGSMGGAGLYDMVYIAGLLSFFLSFIFSRKKKIDRKGYILERIKKDILVAEKFGKSGLWKYYEMLEKENGWELRRKVNKLAKKIGYEMKNYYADEGERILAFLIDIFIISGFSFILSIFNAFGDFLVSFIISFSIMQIFYFFILEYFFNATIGKAFFDIEIRKENFEKADFMDSFTRNILRFFDMIAFFYIISLILISITPKKQRIGDLITGTIVVRL